MNASSWHGTKRREPTDISLYSIVISVYRSGNWLRELVEKICETMNEGGYRWEVILVNDASPDDKTWPEVSRLAKHYPCVKGIDLLYNVGQFRATLCGIDHARGEFIITMDDDFQHPAEELPTLIETMKSNAGMECIMGYYESKRHGPLRNAGSRLMSRIMNRMYNKPSNIVTTSFRIMPAEFARKLSLYRVAHPQIGPLIVTLTGKLMNVPVEHRSRPYGRSGYSLRSSARETFRSIINASIFPLRVFSMIGFASAGLAFVVSGWFFLRWWFGGINVAGFTSLILAISFFSGMMLLGIGVLGEYVGRLINEVTGMPRYYVRETTEHDCE